MDNRTEKTMRLHPDDVVVISFQSLLSESQREQAHEDADNAFPNNEVVIVDNGTTIGILGQQEQLDRVEAKLDALLEALEDEYDEDDEPELSLDGSLVGGERDTSEAL